MLQVQIATRVQLCVRPPPQPPPCALSLPPNTIPPPPPPGPALPPRFCPCPCLNFPFSPDARMPVTSLVCVCVGGGYFGGDCQRPFFFAFWPQYYITAKPAHELGPATASTVQWPPHNMSRMESPLADSKAGGHSHSHAGKWRDARRLDQLDGLDALDAQCHDIPVFLPGLGPCCVFLLACLPFVLCFSLSLCLSLSLLCQPALACEACSCVSCVCPVC